MKSSLDCIDKVNDRPKTILNSTTNQGRGKQTNSVDHEEGCGFLEAKINDNGPEVVLEHERMKRLIYKVSESPPLRLVLLFTLQQGLLAVSAALSVSLLVAEVACAREDAELKTQILSSTFFMVGLSTFCMSTIGVRLPIFQGPASPYIIPLLALSSLPDWKCPTQDDLVQHYANVSTNISETVNGNLPVPREIIYQKLQLMSGSLMVAGGLHFLIGATGLIGFLLKFIGPVTIVPAVTLIGLYVYKVAVTFSESHWGVAMLTAGIALVLSLYLSKCATPIPLWNRRRGFYIRWYPVHQIFAILISMIIGWAVSAILTSANVLSSDRNSVQFYARTDTQMHVITNTAWFLFPYPGQFGFPAFNGGVFVSFFIATLMSVLDSIGDYSACARMCNVPQPPGWVVNRGIAVEGLMSVLSGAMGVGHATVSFGGNIGAIGITRVASRRVFQAVGLMYFAFAILSKVGAVFVTIPYSVLGGTQIVTNGIFIGVVLSNLQYVDLGSTRNVAIIGISLLLGMMTPYWVQKHPGATITGHVETDHVLRMLLSNPVFVCGCVACFLDNTVPGTPQERGMRMYEHQEKLMQADTDDKEGFEEGLEVYDLLWLPERIKRSPLAKILRICPGNMPSRKGADKICSKLHIPVEV